MPPSNIGLTEHAIPLETAGTTFIYAAETLEEAEGLAHGDPFWSSGEVVSPFYSNRGALEDTDIYVEQWDKAQVKIIPVSVVINNLPTKKFP